MENLKVTRDIIVDLLPAYQSGEASEDTQRLVREFLERYPEFSRWVGRLENVQLNGAKVLPLPETGLKSLNRTKRLMKLQNVAMAAAIFFSLAPFSFFFEEGRISFLLLRDAPTVAGAYLLVALVMWLVYAIMRRKLKVF